MRWSGVLVCAFLLLSSRSTGKPSSSSSSWNEVRRHFPHLQRDDDKIAALKQQRNRLLKSCRKFSTSSSSSSSSNSSSSSDSDGESRRVRFRNKVEIIPERIKTIRKRRRKHAGVAANGLKEDMAVTRGRFIDYLKILPAVEKEGPVSTGGYLWSSENDAREPIASNFGGQSMSRNFEHMSGCIAQPVDAGWWLIKFGKDMHQIPTRFSFESVVPVLMLIVDLYEPGDSFAVFDHKQFIAQTSRNLLPMPMDKSSLDPRWTPFDYFADGRWSSALLRLEPHKSHEIEIQAVDSPQGGGVAAVHFFYDFSNLPTCRLNTNKMKSLATRYIIYDDKVAWSEAEHACSSINSELADVDSLKDKIVLLLMASCDTDEAWYRKGKMKLRKKGQKMKNEPANSTDKHAVLCKLKQ